MKRKFFKFALVIGLALHSCSETEVVEKINTTNGEQQRLSSMFNYISSIKIDERQETECETDILIFPSWQKYNETIEKLDELTETYCDNFDATVPANISDETYDALCDASGFDEDNVLRNFENDLAFCSLRKKIENDESIWLNAQGDGEWNTNEDPDNDFIDEESERALLSTGHEVIIGTRKDGYKIYKFLNDSGSMIVINGLDLTTLVHINNGKDPMSFSNVTLVNNTKPSSCKNKNDIRKYFTISSNTKMKTTDKFSHSTLIGNPKVKVKTKYYRKKLGKWKKGRATIMSKITTISGLQCGAGIMPLPKEKTRRRHKVIVKWTGIELNSINPEIIDDATFGIHKWVPGNYDKKIDMYDGQVY